MLKYKMGNLIDSTNVGDFLGPAPSFGEYTGAIFDNAWSETPTQSARNLSAMSSSSRGRNRTLVDQDNNTPLDNESFYSNEYYRPGLIFKPGMNVGKLKLLADEFDAQTKRDEIISKYPDFYGKSIYEFGVGAAAHMVDPINLGAGIALGLVPGFGWAALGARVGGSIAAGVARGAALGVAEGVVIETALQPLIYAGQNAFQKDYTFYDALQNVMFAGAGGAVLGGAVGGFSSYAKRLSSKGLIDPQDESTFNGIQSRDIAQNVSNAILAVENGTLDVMNPVIKGQPAEIKLSDRNLLDEIMSSDNSIESAISRVGQNTYFDEFDTFLRTQENLGLTNEINAGKIKLNEITSDIDKLIFPTPEIENIIRQFVDDSLQPRKLVGTKTDELGFIEEEFKNIKSLILRGGPGTGKSSVGNILTKKYGDKAKFYRPEDLDDQEISKLALGGDIKFMVFDEFDKFNSSQIKSINELMTNYPGTRFIFTSNKDPKDLSSDFNQIVSGSEDILMDNYNPDQLATYAVSLARETGMMGAPVDNIVNWAKAPNPSTGKIKSFRNIKTELESFLNQKGKKLITKYDNISSLFGEDMGELPDVPKNIDKLPLRSDQKQKIVEFLENTSSKPILMIRGNDKSKITTTQKTIKESVSKFDILKIGGEEVITKFNSNTIRSIQKALENPYKGDGFGWLIQIDGNINTLKGLAINNSKLEELINSSPLRPRIVITFNKMPKISKADQLIVNSVIDRSSVLEINKGISAEPLTAGVKRGVPNKVLRNRSQIAQDFVSDNELKSSLLNAIRSSDPEVRNAALERLEGITQFVDDTELELAPNLPQTILPNIDQLKRLDETLSEFDFNPINYERLLSQQDATMNSLLNSMEIRYNELMKEIEPKSNTELKKLYDILVDEFPGISDRIKNSQSYLDVKAKSDFEDNLKNKIVEEPLPVSEVEIKAEIITEKANTSRERLAAIRDKLSNDQELLKDWDNLEVNVLEKEISDIDETLSLLNDTNFIKAASNAIKCLRS